MYTIWNCIKPGIDIGLVGPQIERVLVAEISLLERYTSSQNQVRDFHLREGFFQMREGRAFLEKQFRDTVQLRSN